MPPYAIFSASNIVSQIQDFGLSFQFSFLVGKHNHYKQCITKVKHLLNRYYAFKFKHLEQLLQTGKKSPGEPG